MLYDKPKDPNDPRVTEYRYLARAVEDAQRAFNATDVTTRQVYWLTPYPKGGGLRRPLTPGEPVEDKTLGYYDRQRAARLVRRLKNAATLDVIDGRRLGVGFQWRTRNWISTHTLFNQTINTASFMRPNAFAAITGVV